MWENTKNLTGVEKGKFRSIAGYAGESIAIGRALLCGYNLFFKAWRDAKYDAVLDYEGVLFRIEIKQTATTERISVTSGGRSGKQIDRSAQSREKVLSTADCDFLIGVQVLSGACWIVPIELVEIFEKKSLRFDSIEPFSECWNLFSLNDPHLGISPSDIRTGFRDRPIAELDALCKKLHIPIPQKLSIQVGPRTQIDLTDSDYRVARIWQELTHRARATRCS